MTRSRDITLSAEGLGKRYRLGGARNAYDTLRESVRRAPLRSRAEVERTLWALRDVSFEMRRGEALGVIGHNGAGKTTLLKILSRITPPTEGQATVRGSVGSLLEVGTGFHPELTGRENVYLNGAILGMRKREIARKFDEIVAFAEVSQFLDTPVKRYSTGMQVRLAFAVAAHLDADVLLVDEVLSVGDFGFQRRSLGKMQEQTSNEGRTVLFVSHNLGAIKAMTDRCLWLEKGGIRALGPTEDVFREYIRSYGETVGEGRVDLSDRTRNRPKSLPGDVTFESLALIDASGRAASVHLEREPILADVRVRVHVPLRDVHLEIVGRLSSADGVLVFSAASPVAAGAVELGVYETSLALDPNFLAAGTYSIELLVTTRSELVGDKTHDLVRPAVTFHVERNPGTGDGYISQEPQGVIALPYAWRELVAAEETPAQENRGR